MKYVISITLYLLASSLAIAQGLEITSPKDGIVVRQGDVVSVRVIKRDPKIQHVMVLGDLLDTPSAIQSNLTDMIFQVPVSVTKTPGRYRIGAADTQSLGTNAPGAIAGPINIVVVPKSEIASVSTEPESLGLEYVGDERRIQVIGHGATRNVALTELPGVTFKSSNPTIAEVDSRGRVIAVGSGATSIVVSYGNLTTNVAVSVPTYKRGDLDGNGAVDTDDLHILQEWLNSGANGTNDARDLNKDGKIDALDLRVLTTLCTRLRCATQ
jgi:Dockerin type I domain